MDGNISTPLTIDTDDLNKFNDKVKMWLSIDEEIIQYYPIDFELDAVLGGKHIYSEPILPIADADKIDE